MGAGRVARASAAGLAGLRLSVAAAAVGLAALRFGDVSTFVVMSGSMEPAIPVGSLVAVVPALPEAVGIGDVITYRLPDRLVTHRVVAVASADGAPVFTTKGDANLDPDPAPIRPVRSLGRVVTTVPAIGYVIHTLQAQWRAVAAAFLVGFFLAAIAERRLRRRAAVTASALVLAMTIGAGAPAAAAFASVARNAANSAATGTSLWFGIEVSGLAPCTGADALLACPLGSLATPSRTTATLAAANKNVAATYTLAIANGSGPQPIDTLVTPSFLSTGTASATLAPAGTDSITLAVRLKGGTPLGAYTGTLVVTETATGRSAAIPISFTAV